MILNIDFQLIQVCTQESSVVVYFRKEGTCHQCPLVNKWNLSHVGSYVINVNFVNKYMEESKI